MRKQAPTLTLKPRRQTWHGRSGQHEMVTLTTWTRHGSGHVRVKGHYDVYCGMGGEHRVALDVMDYTDRMPNQVVDLDDAMDHLVGEWLAYDYQPCDCGVA